MSEHQLTITPLSGIPPVRPGDDLSGLLISALERSGFAPRDCDILAVTQKIVSKAEGRYLDLGAVEPGARAKDLAAVTEKDPHLVEAILSESAEVLRAKPHVLIACTPHGLVLANAGIDQSNLEAGDHGRRVLLLPEDPDASALRIKRRIDAHFQSDIGVIITDSAGRAWRLGTVGLAIGAAGVPVLLDARGKGHGRSPARGHRGRICRCRCGRSGPGHGRSGRSAPGGPRARYRLERRGPPSRRFGATQE